VGAFDIVLEAGAYLSMVAEGFKRRRRHGVHGARTDDLVDVQDVAVLRVFLLVLPQGRRCRWALLSTKAFQRAPRKISLER